MLRVLIFLVIWYLGEDDKITLILYTNIYIFKVTFKPEKLEICAIIFRYADMPQPSQRISSPLTLPILKKQSLIYRHIVSKCTVIVTCTKV